MSTGNIQLNVVARKNKNRKSPGFGNFYYKTNNNKTITTRAFLQHIQDHGLSIPTSIMQAAFSQITSCLRELVLTGQPVKLDGLGTITPYVTSKGFTVEDKASAKEFASQTGLKECLQGLHFRLIPDGTEWDNTQSPKNLAKASLNFEGIEITATDGSASFDPEVKKKGIVSVAQYKELITPPHP